MFHFVSQLRHILIGKNCWCLAQGEAMPFDLGWLRFLIDPIKLDDEMLNMA
jgi:hypothetical protein